MVPAGLEEDDDNDGIVLCETSVAMFLLSSLLIIARLHFFLETLIEKQVRGRRK